LIIKFETKSLERIDYLSIYNNNYYKLPIEIEGCDTLFEECDENYNVYYWTLGNIKNSQFEGKVKFYGEHGNEDINPLKHRIELDEYLT
jgi:hypothetical protein